MSKRVLPVARGLPSSRARSHMVVEVCTEQGPAEAMRGDSSLRGQDPHAGRLTDVALPGCLQAYACWSFPGREEGGGPRLVRLTCNRSAATAGFQETRNALTGLHGKLQLVRWGLIGTCSGPGGPLESHLTADLSGGEVAVIIYRRALPKELSEARGKFSNLLIQQGRCQHQC